MRDRLRHLELRHRDAATGAAACALVELEPGHRDDADRGLLSSPTAPTAHEPPRGCTAAPRVAAYVDGLDGRLMRSMKSILGSSLVEQSTDVGGGRAVRYLDVIAGYLRHLKAVAERAAGARDRARGARPPGVLRRRRPGARRAGAGRAGSARRATVGFDEVRFQYEPIAAAFDYERRVDREQLVLVADIGGGTSDFSLVRVGPERRGRARRATTTSWPTTACTWPAPTSTATSSWRPSCRWPATARSGPRAPATPPREVPSGVYFDLATWHLINTVYTPARVGRAAAHARLLRRSARTTSA